MTKKFVSKHGRKLTCTYCAMLLYTRHYFSVLSEKSKSVKAVSLLTEVIKVMYQHKLQSLEGSGELMTAADSIWP